MVKLEIQGTASIVSESGESGQFAALFIYMNRAENQHDIKPDKVIIMSKDRLQQILVNLIIVNKRRESTPKNTFLII